MAHGMAATTRSLATGIVCAQLGGLTQQSAQQLFAFTHVLSVLHLRMAHQISRIHHKSTHMVEIGPRQPVPL